MSCKPVDQKRKPYTKAPSALHKDSRVRYWNEDYVQYWQSRVSEANTASKTSSEMVLGDSLTSADTHYENAINLLEIDHILIVVLHHEHLYE